MLPACDALPALVTALPCCCCSAYPQHPSTQRHGQPSCSGPLPLARLSSVLSAPDPNTDTPGDSYQPPLLICTVSTRHQKLRLYLFVPRKSPAWNTRPGIDAPQKFYKQKSGLGPRRRRGRGWRTPGRVARLPPGLTSLGAPFRGRGGAVTGLGAVDLPCLVEV